MQRRVVVASEGQASIRPKMCEYVAEVGSFDCAVATLCAAATSLRMTNHETCCCIALLRVFIPQPRLTVGHWNRPALDVHLLDIGFHVERIAVGDHHVGGFAYVERA